MKTNIIVFIFIIVAYFDIYAEERPINFSEEQRLEFLESAPQAPGINAYDLKVQLVDYIDFRLPDPGHDFFDRGTSRVVDGAAGKYRETASHRHAQMTVRWKSAAIDQPHLLIYEYPDDAERQICFFTHESRLTGKMNLDWSLETGVNCGGPFPLSGTMNYHSQFFWPSDTYPVAMVMNWARNGAPAAVSRLWVYHIQQDLPPLLDFKTKPSKRLLGTFYNWSLVPTTGIYGLTNPETAYQHLIDYHLYRGENIISWPVVTNHTWGFRCIIPEWDGGNGENGGKVVELEKVLAACNAKGMKFLPIFNVGHRFILSGKTDHESHLEERRAILEAGYASFIKRYGNDPAIIGIGFDSQDLSPAYTVSGLDQLRKSWGNLTAAISYLKKLKPDWNYYHFLGSKNIHKMYFLDKGTELADVLSEWESVCDLKHVSFPDFLSEKVLSLWKSWLRDPAELNSITDLITILSYQIDDYNIYDDYYHNTRASFYYDLEASSLKRSYFPSRKALIWNTFYEGYIGLGKDNWWYRKEWVAPDFNAVGALALYGWNLAMRDVDCDLILAGAWNQKGGGRELELRKFAKAFHALGKELLKDIKIEGSIPLTARYGHQRLCLINHSPFNEIIRVDNKDYNLQAYEMKTISLDKTPNEVLGEASMQYTSWIDRRLMSYQQCLERLSQQTSVPVAYQQQYNIAKEQFTRGQYYAADLSLGYGLGVELNTRLLILNPPLFEVPQLSEDQNEDEAPFTHQSDDTNISTHIFFPNQWDGPNDASVKTDIWHGNNKLFINLIVSDNVFAEKDEVKLFLSPRNYKSLELRKLPYEYEISIPYSMDRGQSYSIQGDFYEGTVDITDQNMTIALIIKLEHFDLEDNRLGYYLHYLDVDRGNHLFKSAWARKQVVSVPNQQIFENYADARSCGELVLLP